jgi:hypothetical protein
VEDVSSWPVCKNIYNIKRNTEALLEASKEVRLEINKEKSKSVYGGVTSQKYTTKSHFTDS